MASTRCITSTDPCGAAGYNGFWAPCMRRRVFSPPHVGRLFVPLIQRRRRSTAAESVSPTRRLSFGSLGVVCLTYTVRKWACLPYGCLVGDCLTVRVAKPSDGGSLIPIAQINHEKFYSLRTKSTVYTALATFPSKQNESKRSYSTMRSCRCRFPPRASLASRVPLAGLAEIRTVHIPRLCRRFSPQVACMIVRQPHAPLDTRQQGSLSHIFSWHPANRALSNHTTYSP